MRVCRMLQIRDTQLISSLPPSLCVSALPGHDVFSDVIELGRGAQSNLLVGVEDNLNRGSALLRRQAQEAPRDGHQTLHIIMHNTPRGLHIFSDDGGRSFALQQALGAGGAPLAPFVYEETVAQTDGSNFTCGRRERPWLLLGGGPRGDAPTALGTAVQAPAVHAGTFTHVQPIGGAGRR